MADANFREAIRNKMPVLKQPDATIAAVQNEYFNQMINNTSKLFVCPCCARKNKIYKYRVNGTMIRHIIQWRKIAEAKNGNPQEWVHASHEFPQGRASALKFRYWQIIEKLEGRGPDGRPTSGLWRLTDGGLAFVNNLARTYQYVYVFQDEVLYYGGDIYSIEEYCDAEGFRWEELFRG